MKLSIIIVNWNVKDLLRKCLESIYKNSPLCDYEVIVVDNASTDGSVEMLKMFSSPSPSGRSLSPPKAGRVRGEGLERNSGVRVIENKKNLGFSAANNQAIKIAKGEYLLILNPDTEVLPGAIDTLIGFLDKNPDAGIVAPKLLNPDGSLQKSCLSFPTFGAMAARQLFLEAIWPNNPFSKKYMMLDFKYDKTTEIDQPMGACMLARRNVIDEIGLFDERSFMFFDEVDLCFRAKRAGWKIFFTPDAEIIHHGGVSIKKWGFHNLSRHWTRSRNYFFKKHYGRHSVFLLTVADLTKTVLVILLMLLIFRIIARLLLFVFS